MTQRIFILLASTTLLGACSIIQPRPVVENRFAGYDSHNAVPGEVGLLRLSVASADPETPSKGIKISDLGDRAQAALIEAYKGKPPTVLKPASSGGGLVEDRTSQSRVLVVSTVPLSFLEPGDRIDAMQISLRVNRGKSDGWRVVGWDVAATDKQVIKVGSLTDESSNKVSASTGLGLGPALPSAEIGFEASHSKTSAMDVEDMSTLDAAVDADGTAWVLQTGGWRNNLAHNVGIEVQLGYDGDPKETFYFTTSKLFEDDGDNAGKPVAPAKVKLKEQRVLIPVEANPVCGLAEVTYRLRTITNPKGRATFTEADDQIVLKTYTSPTPVPFILAPAPSHRFFSIMSAKDTLQYMPGAIGNIIDLQFDTLEDARQFISWLQAADFTKTAIGSGKIGIGSPDSDDLIPLDRRQLAGLVPRQGDAGPVETACLSSGRK